MHFNFAYDYATWRVQVNQDGLKLNGTHQLLVYADDVIYWVDAYILRKKNKDTTVVASKETGIEVNAHITKYMVMPQDQNAGQSHNIKIDKQFLTKCGAIQIFRNHTNTSKFYSGRNQEQTEVRECWLSFSAESFAFEFATQKYKDQDIQKYSTPNQME